jgi:hypothetical protein
MVAQAIAEAPGVLAGPRIQCREWKRVETN